MPARSAPPAPEASSGSLAGLPPVLLVRAAHPRQAVLTAAGMALAAGLTGRSWREVGLVAATVVVGQAVLGWDNDLVDQQTDRAADRTDKPLATGALERGTVGFALACAVLLLVPLALSSGTAAGLAYLGSVLVGLAGNRWLRAGFLSWLPWAVAFALYPAYLSYGGWGGGVHGGPPSVAMTVLAAALGVGVHVLTSLPGLVDDRAAGRNHLPLRLGLRLGAPRLLLLTASYCVVVAGLALLGWLSR